MPISIFFIAGIIITQILMPLIWFGGIIFQLEIGKSIFLSIVILYWVFTVFALEKLIRFPLLNKYAVSVALNLFLFGILSLLLLLMRGYFSRSFLVVSLAIFISLSLLHAHFLHRVKVLRFGLINGSLLDQMQGIGLVNLKIIEDVDDLDALAGLDALIFESQHIDRRSDLYEYCILNEIQLINAYRFYEQRVGKVIEIDQDILLSYNYFNRRIFSSTKYIYELIFIILFSPIWLPLLILSGLFIFVTDGGPILFSQERVGFRGRVFRIYKLRTMKGTSKQVNFAPNEQHRLILGAKWMRKARIDELPQLIQVCLGQMSLVGPRPEQVSMDERYCERNENYKFRRISRPGITGWSQVHLGYSSDDETASEKLDYDLYYCFYGSFWLDLVVLFKTVIFLLKFRE